MRAAPLKTASAHVVLFTGLVLVSTAAPFLKLASMDAFAVVFLRMACAAPLFLAWAAWRGRLSVPPGEGGRVVLGGVLLAAHFLLWVKAFDLTDYSSNLILLVAQPIIAALLGRFAGEPATARTWTAVWLALAGLLLVAGADVSLGARALLGDLLCVLAGLAISLYFLVTRRARSAMSMDAFMGVTTAVGAAAALPVVLLAGSPVLGYPATSWGWLAGLVLLATVGGHGCMNLAARGLPLFSVNIVIVLEPPIGMLMGAAFFPVTVRPLQAVGGVFLAAAVLVALRRPRRVDLPEYGMVTGGQ